MTKELVYDVGAFDGTDTGYYLTQGYRVVAIEADPVLARRLSDNFKTKVADKSLIVVNEGIADHDGEMPFYLCPSDPGLNTFNVERLLARGMNFTETKVKCRPFAAMLADYGTPLFMKIDIEGNDYLCLRSLGTQTAPRFLSWEATQDVVEQLLLAKSLGYQKFALVNQSNFADVRIPRAATPAHCLWSVRQAARKLINSTRRLRDENRNPSTNGFTVGLSSGPTPMERKQGWLDFEQAVYAWSNLVSSEQTRGTWFDVHAERA